LLAGGMAGDLPAAAVQSASTARQRHVVATVSTLPDALVAAGIESPAVLVFGDVVRCADAGWVGLADEPRDRRAG
jgi:uroporphyrin-III C-methyltransferase